MKICRSPVAWISAVFLSFLMVGSAAGFKNNAGLHSAMPAGYDVVALRPSGANISLMGLIECPELEGAQQISEGREAEVISADGKRMNKFPSHFNFRITASLRKIILDKPMSSVTVLDDPYDLLLKLKFRIKAYRGLEMREITPDSVELIGMPASVRYDERVYRIGVNLGDAPITDRVVIDVLTPEGKFITHFPFSVL
ncbi:MAG TPA: hypothetical protein VFB76_03915 [Candidatus Angelobacter sp.]|nr:hypothetical protein [Candidatus Angelobacter sp.]